MKAEEASEPGIPVSSFDQVRVYAAVMSRPSRGLVFTWMLAVPLSAVFKMAGAGATDESSALLRGRRWRSLLFLVVSGLVSCNFAAPLRCIGLCDVLNIAHPFTECPSFGKLAWGALVCVTGTLADIAALYGFVALVVYIRRLKEPIDADARPPRRLAVLLVATGLALAVAVPIMVQSGITNAGSFTWTRRVYSA